MWVLWLKAGLIAVFGGSDGKESTYTIGDLGSIPGLGRSPREGNNYPLQCSSLENSMDRGAYWATVHGVAESDVTEPLTLSLHPQEWQQGGHAHAGSSTKTD